LLTHSDKEVKSGFILPFTTSTAKKLKDLTKSMELAAILYLAESGREKRESRIFRKTDEKLVFVTKAFYPIWLVPYRRATLIFDGFSCTSHTLFYDRTPDIERFNKDIRINLKAIESYTATLIRNKDYFKNFSGKEEKKIEGLIANSELIEDLRKYLYKRKKAKSYLKNKKVLPNKIGNAEIKEAVRQLLNLRKRTAKDIQMLENSMQFLSTITVRKIRMVRREIKKTQNRYIKRIERVKPRVKKEILRIQSRYNQKIVGKSTKFKKEIQQLHEDHIELQKTLGRLKTETRKCKIKIRSHKNDGKAQLNLKLKRIEKKLPTLSKEISANVKRTRKVESDLKLEISRLRIECDEHTEAANKIFLDLQASRDAEITLRQREIATLQSLTREITYFMREMIQTKRVFIKELDTIAVAGKKRACELVCLPFYLARYEKGDKKRYVVYPPIAVEDIGILTKMKGAFGASKLKSLLQCRSKAIATFLNQLLIYVEKDPVLEKNITEAGIEASMLIGKRLRLAVKKGLIELEKQNWVSKKEFQSICKVLYIYTDASSKSSLMR
jgi:uncharacterized protein YukE